MSVAQQQFVRSWHLADVRVLAYVRFCDSADLTQPVFAGHRDRALLNREDGKAALTLVVPIVAFAIVYALAASKGQGKPK
jgi:hypothetical protein